MGVRIQLESEAAWVDIGVDDLMKYRIVEYLCGRPGEVADVGCLASALGFHSLEQTRAELEELEASGVVWLDEPPGEPPRCGVTDDPRLRSVLHRLLDQQRRSDNAATLLAQLAKRSLARVQARVQGKGPRGHGEPEGAATAAVPLSPGRWSGTGSPVPVEIRQ